MFSKSERDSFKFLNRVWKITNRHIYREESFRNSVSRGVAVGIKSDMNLVLISVAGCPELHPGFDPLPVLHHIVSNGKFLDS
jgi:hypothetical protein